MDATAPAGAVMFFNLASCPSGWTELTDARGRYLVGLPLGGTLGGTDGTALADLEDRLTGQHSHTLSDPGHSHSYTDSWADINGATGVSKKPLYGFKPATGHPDVSAFNSAATGISVDVAGSVAGSVAGTNAPYMQLLVCQKD